MPERVKSCLAGFSIGIFLMVIIYSQKEVEVPKLKPPPMILLYCMNETTNQWEPCIDKYGMLYTIQGFSHMVQFVRFNDPTYKQ